MQEIQPGITQIVRVPFILSALFDNCLGAYFMSDHSTIQFWNLRMPRNSMISIGDSGTFGKLMRRISTYTIHAPGVHIYEKDSHNNNPLKKCSV